MKGLKEWNFGLFEAQPEALQPKIRSGAHSFEDAFVAYGGENVTEVGRRMKATLTQLLEQESGVVLAVSHGGAMWVFLLELSIEPDPTARFGNCAICHYEYENGAFHLVRIIDPLSGEVYERK
ncbi:phosphoglycerate mutase family protein [Streptococcus massiliensis]|uniref:Phosphoglycerate mutase family protein n=1 Tax=Streptococcus massiliensis TaxID=313439 RepID=A0A380L0U1_9STRE|nr:phosphoglycerate mutase family protein [Streptococcus massiliensis]